MSRDTMPDVRAAGGPPASGFWKILLVALLCVLPSLWGGLQLDDYFHWALINHIDGVPRIELAGSPWGLFGFLDGDPARAHSLMEAGMLPWWTLPDVHYAFWRPLVEFTHAIDYRLWPDLPMLMHAQSLVWFAVMLWLAHRLFANLLAAESARWASVVFALHYSHGLPAGWLANRNSLLATALSLLCLLFWLQRKRLASWCAFAAALLCGEMGVSAGLMVFAATLTLDTRAARARLIDLLPYAAIGLIWLVARKMLGYGAQGSGHYLDPTQDLAGFAAVFLQRAADLLNGMFLPVPPEIASAMPLTVRALLASLVLLVAILALWRPLRTRADARFLVLAMVLCLVPAAATAPHSRLLMCVSVAAGGLLGMAIAALRDPLVRAQRWRKLVFALAMLVFCVFSPLLLAFESVSIRLAMDGMINNGARHLQWQTADRDTRLVVINAPLASVAGYLPGIRLHDGLEPPRKAYTLVSGRVPVSIEVIDDHTLVLQQPEGIYDAAQEALLRSPSRPLTVGERVILADMTVTVDALADNGVPARITITFNRELNDQGFRFVVWNRGQLSDCQWGKAGSTITLTLLSADCSGK